MEANSNRSTMTKIELQNAIFRILSDLKIPKKVDVTKTTTDIMKEVDKYCRDNYATEVASPEAGESGNITPKSQKSAQPRKLTNRLDENDPNRENEPKRKNQPSKRVSRQLSCLSSYGFIERPPVAGKRTSRAVSRFGDVNDEPKTRRSSSTSNRQGKKKDVPPKEKAKSAQHKATAIVAQQNETSMPKPNFVYKRFQMVHYPMVDVKAEPSA
ncbi:uncharacterized protein LOC116349135 [Contarinia nasturtii]|uniref:uncharacterized protein LOC116349135 n=1 Tax=Contarinia nasturtii TaxID=265458 RepID=UPI0012D3A2CC|nr:uncharacterized protein LOC116349135 [Contarinia nasturtii]